MINMMAGDLKAMIKYLDSHEEVAKSSLSGNLEQVYKWINSMDIVYNQIENDIDHLSAKINAFQLETFTATVREKLAKTVKGMMDYDFMSSNVLQQGTEVLQFVQRLNDLSGSLKSKTSSITQKVKGKVESVEVDTEDSSSYSGFLFLSFVILAIAAFFYFRMNKIQEKTHIL